MRDTDADWQQIGSSEPYFGVLSAAEYLRGNLDEDRVRHFYLTGEWDVAGILATVERIFGAFHPARALDFGCGVGRLVLAMAARSGHVTGVDIAPAMLAEAGRNAELRGITNVSFSQDIPDEQIDWVNSHIVLQHIAPEVGYRYIETLLSRLAPGGVATLHVTAYRTIHHLAPTINDIGFCSYDGRDLRVLSAAEDSGPVGQMRMYDYDMTRVLALYGQAGLNQIFCEHFDHGGHHGFRVTGRKA